MLKIYQTIDIGIPSRNQALIANGTPTTCQVLLHISNILPDIMDITFSYSPIFKEH
jgi:hypothetical protein